MPPRRGRTGSRSARGPDGPDAAQGRSPRRRAQRRGRVRARSSARPGPTPPPKTRWRRARRRSVRRRPDGSGCRRARGSSSSAGTSRRRRADVAESPSPSAKRHPRHDEQLVEHIGAVRLEHGELVGGRCHGRPPPPGSCSTSFAAARVLERLRHDLAHLEDRGESSAISACASTGRAGAKSRVRASRPAARCPAVRACRGWPRGSAPTPRRW